MEVPSFKATFGIAVRELAAIVNRAQLERVVKEVLWYSAG